MLIEGPAAVVSGPSAALLALLLRSPNVATVVRTLPAWARPHRAEIEAAVAAIDRAGRAWSSGAVSFERNDETGSSEIGPDSPRRVTTGMAAQLLGLSPRRTQQLAAAGLLGGTRVGRLWLLDKDAVRLMAEGRRTA